MARGTLVLGRKVGERVIIGTGSNAVTIEVLPPRGADRMRMKICAPVETSVRREELPERGERANA